MFCRLDTDALTGIGWPAGRRLGPKRSCGPNGGPEGHPNVNPNVVNACFTMEIRTPQNLDMIGKKSSKSVKNELKKMEKLCLIGFVYVFGHQGSSMVVKDKRVLQVTSANDHKWLFHQFHDL